MLRLPHVSTGLRHGPLVFIAGPRGVRSGPGRVIKWKFFWVHAR